MSDTQAFIEELRSKHAMYAAELVMHKLYLDSYAGSGGFQGRERMPLASWWGSAADIYSQNEVAIDSLDRGSEGGLDTYLDRFPREELPKFRRRQGSAFYSNFIEPVVNLRLSYLTRKGLMRDGLEEEEGEASFPLTVDWMADVDGRGNSLDTVYRDTILIRAAVLGWCPVLIDKPPVPEGYSKQQADDDGLLLRLIPLFPANLYDWYVDDRGAFVWCKIVTAEHGRPDPFGPFVCRTTYTYWYVDHASIYVTERHEEGEETLVHEQVLPHQWGKVPVEIFRHSPCADDPVRGVSMVASLVPIARRLFNVDSEMDEHLRQSVFAFLQVPTSGTLGINDDGELVIGSGNALPVPLDSSRDYKWVSPDASVATTLKERSETLVESIYRIGRTEFTKGKASDASGVSRSFEFETTNRAIADFANSFARSDERLLRLVAIATGDSRDRSALRTIRTTAPSNFDVEEMTKEIEEAISTIIGVKVGATATGEIRKRVIRKMLPNIDPAKLEEIDQEIEDLGNGEAGMTAMDGEMTKALLSQANEDPNEDPAEPTDSAPDSAKPAPKKKSGR